MKRFQVSLKWTVKFTYTSDSGRSADTLELYKANNSKYVGVVNGEQISYVYKTAITSLQEQFTNATKSSPKDDK